MALQFPDNRYPGINAHLHSYMQHDEGIWSSFHFELIDAIDSELEFLLSGRHMPLYGWVFKNRMQL